MSGVVFAAGNRIQVDLLPIAAFDAGADPCWSPAFARHLIGVIALFSAGPTFGAMQILETTAEAGVSDGPVAAAIAGQLIQDAGDLGCILVDLHLPRQLEVRSSQLFPAKNGRELGVCRRRSRVECRDVDCWIRPLGVSCNTNKCDDKGQPNTATHQSSSPESISKIVRSFRRKAEISDFTAIPETASNETAAMRIPAREIAKNRAKKYSRTSYNGNPWQVFGEAQEHIIHREYLQKC